MDRARLKFLFNRYVTHSCTDKERKEFLSLLSDAENNDQLKDLMDDLWSDLPGRKLPALRSKEILNQILGEENEFVDSNNPKIFPYWNKIAATLIFLVLCTGALFYFDAFQKPQNQLVNNEVLHTAEPSFIKLPDGSTVILNAGSKLEYPVSFNGQAREVFLVGEGYFDIAHDSSREFIVHTGKLKTTVLGTAFNIKAYPDQENITVTVTRGKVKVSDDKKVFGIVNPNQQITFDKTHQQAQQKIVDSHTVTAWVEKDIFFDDVTLGEVADQLAKRFNVEIIISNEQIKNCRFTATFVKGEDLEQILRIICEFNGATFMENNPGTIRISGGACPL